MLNNNIKTTAIGNSNNVMGKVCTKYKLKMMYTIKPMMKSNNETAIDENAMIKRGKYTFETKLLLANIELLTA
jgi:hypothetical protein